LLLLGLEAFYDISFFHFGYYGFGKVDENVDGMFFFLIKLAMLLDNCFNGEVLSEQ